MSPVTYFIYVKDITAGEGSEYGDSGIDGGAAEVEHSSRVARPCLLPSPSTLLLAEVSLLEATAAVAAEVEETVNVNRVEIKVYTKTSVRSWT